MATLKEIHVPDLGGANNVPVIEILVKPGDRVHQEQGLVTLESDKATMEVPSSDAGIVKDVKVKVGDKVSEGSVVVVLEVEGESSAAIIPEAKTETAPSITTIEVPDIGGASNVPVIEVLVKVGDHVQAEQGLVTLESDKATMDVPSPVAGVVKAVKIKVGDKVSQGSEIVVIESQGSAKAAPAESVSKPQAPKAQVPVAAAPLPPAALPAVGAEVYAGPAVRRIAREFGVDLRRVKGTGRKNRLTVDDVRLYVRGELAKTQSGAGVGSGLPEAPVVDFAKFGAIEKLPLTRIQKLSSKGLHRNWLLVPHVTQFGEADITLLEETRAKEKAAAEKQGIKLTPLVFIMKAVVSALKEFPRFNSSLAPDGENIILKKYFHIGVAVDTPDGLVVPVVRDVDQKDIFVLAKELSELSAKARDGQLKPQDMQGGCFSISSLGGIGGTAFTPIVNVPEVAILGVSRSFMKPVFDGKTFVPRLTLPLSLSYDHRVIDGAVGARFISYLSDRLADLK